MAPWLSAWPDMGSVGFVPTGNVARTHFCTTPDEVVRDA